MNLKILIYRLIRPLFVKDIDPNEDFACIMCGEVILKRYLVCSKKCQKAYDNL